MSLFGTITLARIQKNIADESEYVCEMYHCGCYVFASHFSRRSLLRDLRASHQPAAGVDDTSANGLRVRSLYAFDLPLNFLLLRAPPPSTALPSVRDTFSSPLLARAYARAAIVVFSSQFSVFILRAMEWFYRICAVFFCSACCCCCLLLCKKHAFQLSSSDRRETKKCETESLISAERVDCVCSLHNPHTHTRTRILVRNTKREPHSRIPLCCARYEPRTWQPRLLRPSILADNVKLCSVRVLSSKEWKD